MRETGPVRRQLSGDEATPYLGFSRTILGQLKNDMAFNNLPQGVRTRELPDGTVIRVESRYGQDKVTITAPAVGAEVPLAPTEETPLAEEIDIPETPLLEDTLDADHIVVCGTCTDETNAIFRPFIWVPGNAPVEITGAPGSARAHAISGNGQVVVGSFTRAPNDERAFRWTAAGGFVDLGNLGGVKGTGGATGIDYDGGVIAGIAFDAAGVARMWVWTRLAGMQQLPDSYAADAQEFSSPRVSPNGRFICGTRPIQALSYAYVGGSVETGPVRLVQTFALARGGVVWQSQDGIGWTAHPMPLGDATHEQYMDFFTTLPIAWDTNFPVVPYAINDKGEAAGTAWCGVVVPFGGAPIDVYPPGATPRVHTSPGTSSNPLGPLTRWVAGISASGKRTAGNYARTPDKAWVFTEGQGVVEFPEDGAIYAMAPSGVHFAGATGAMRITYFSVLKRTVPMLWTAKGATPIPLLPGATRGWADGIALASVRIPPFPPPPIPFDWGRAGSPISAI